MVLRTFVLWDSPPFHGWAAASSTRRRRLCAAAQCLRWPISAPLSARDPYAPAAFGLRGGGRPARCSSGPLRGSDRPPRALPVESAYSAGSKRVHARKAAHAALPSVQRHGCGRPAMDRAADVEWSTPSSADRAHIQPLAIVEVECTACVSPSGGKYRAVSSSARSRRFRMLAQITLAQILRLIVRTFFARSSVREDRGLVHVELLGDLRRGFCQEG